MTQVISQVSPQKPWRPKLKNLLPEVLGALFTAVSTLLIVAVTPLKGKLGFAIVLIIMAIVVSSLVSGIRRDKKAALNSTTTVLVYIASAFVIIPLFSILYEIFRLGIGGLSFGIFTKDMSLTSSDSPLTEGGLLHALIGTLYVVVLASIISTPVGILASLYIVEVKGRFAGLVRFFIQAMSGIPSIVAGLFIYAIWMINMGNSYNAVAGAGALAILMIPTVARTSEEVLKLIPNDLREAGVALGATQWRTVSGVVVPAARSGLVTAVILGVARIIGETAPILLVSGGADALNFNPTSGPMGSLPFYIWKAFLTGGTEEAYARAWGGMLILLILIMVLFGLARYLSGRKAS